MLSMIAGFVTNIILDYLFVWVLGQGVAGAAWATVIGQGVTMLIALAYLLLKKQFTLNIPFSKFGKVAASIIKIRIAPFGLAMSPNISLIIINRFLWGRASYRDLCLYRICDLHYPSDTTGSKRRKSAIAQ